MWCLKGPHYTDQHATADFHRLSRQLAPHRAKPPPRTHLTVDGPGSENVVLVAVLTFFYNKTLKTVHRTFISAWLWARESPREQRAHMPSSSRSRALTCGLPPTAGNWPPKDLGQDAECVDGAVVSHNLQWGSCHREAKWGIPIISASYSTAHLFGSSAGLGTHCLCDQSQAKR